MYVKVIMKLRRMRKLKRGGFTTKATERYRHKGQISYHRFPADTMSSPPPPPRNGIHVKQYPLPLASHEDVVKHPTLFWDTLRRFHSLLGTKFMIPVIGGKELDLHVLYVEVTKRGGYDKVVADKKWREVSTVFMFSPTTTSASFVLRKHYYSLLHHYEQVYYFRFRGLLPAESAGSPCRLDLIEYSKERYGECAAGGSPSCFYAVGTIDGKFDCGYLVSVKVGSEILNGVLYHPERDIPSTSAHHSLATALVPYTPKPGHSRRRRRKRRGRRGDPSYPKPNRSGYNFFFAEKHSKLKALYPDREREFTKMIGESWSNLSQEERMVYQNIGLMDKERYRKELKEYKERLKLRQPMELSTDY
ncbi:ARID DNA-binding domain [Dillenia turbinata]|uniref:ARID DNA-binding domain n=1 Tax=Dillenia turbinata TaxID=194707 RepID=A0AAN8VQE9_9MAGN